MWRPKTVFYWGQTRQRHLHFAEQNAPTTLAEARRSDSFFRRVPGFRFWLQALRPQRDLQKEGSLYRLRFHSFQCTAVRWDFYLYSFFFLQALSAEQNSPYSPTEGVMECETFSRSLTKQIIDGSSLAHSRRIPAAPREDSCKFLLTQ